MAKARRYYEDSLALSEKLNLRSEIASNLRRLGRLAEAGGDEDQAQRLVLESDDISESLDSMEPLRQALGQYLTEDQVREVCEKLGVDYDNLPGIHFQGKADELTQCM